MPLVKCIKDNEGWWTVGEVYQAEHDGAGFLSVGDDSDTEAAWSLMPVDYADGENNTATYTAIGLDVDFVEVNT